MRPIRYDKFLGVNTVDPAYRLKVEEGVTQLSSCINTDVTRTAGLRRRKGAGVIVTGNYSSVKAFRDSFFLGVDSMGNLVRIEPTGGVTVLKFFVGPTQMRYADTGSWIYFTNGKVIGRTDGSTVVIIPEQTAPSDSRKAFLPAGHLISYSHGRIFVAVDDTLIYSDVRNKDIYRLAGGGDAKPGVTRVSSKIRMAGFLSAGAFISDTEGIYFARGETPEKWIFAPVDGYPALEGEGARLTKIKDPETGQTLPEALFWVSKRSATLGTPEGKVLPLADKNWLVPEGMSQQQTAWRRSGDLNHMISILR